MEVEKRQYKGTGTECMLVIPECYADTNLVNTLLRKTAANHQHCCSKVMSIMKDKEADNFAVGIIDFDKKREQNVYLKEFKLLKASEHLELYVHESRPHYVIFIKKAIEDFVQSCAAATGTDLKRYGFSGDLKELKDRFKKKTSSKDANITRLFKALHEAPEMKRLKEILTYLNENRCAADRRVLAAMFT